MRERVRGKRVFFFFPQEEKKKRERGEYLLDSQHTVTLSFMHGRGGPSSTDRAVESGEKDRTQLMCALESIKGKTIINAQKDKKKKKKGTK